MQGFKGKTKKSQGKAHTSRKNTPKMKKAMGFKGKADKKLTKVSQWQVKGKPVSGQSEANV